jgi:uncharacterized membrane protein
MSGAEEQPEPARTPPVTWWTRHPRWTLGAMIAAFFAVSMYGSVLAYDNFVINAGHSYDLAIFEQAFSSAAHGFHIPFYESSDCVAKARCSFLIVHPSFALYAFVPIYFLAPSAFTLFAIRSVIVGLAALPLFVLTRRVTGSTGRGLLGAGLYLLWAPTLAGDLYSFHVESFLPLEFFTLVALWEAGRYRLAGVVALVSFLTIEVAPVFAFLVAVFFLVPFVPGVLRAARAAGRPAVGWAARLWAWAMSLIRSARASLHHPQARPALLLAALSLVAYFLVNLWLNVVGPTVWGLPTPFGPTGVSALFYDNSSGPLFSSLSVMVASSSFHQTVIFWLILYALVAFIPLLSPRALVLSVPWIVLTFLSVYHRFSTLGSQYTMVAAVPLFLGLAYGLKRVPLGRVDRPPTPAPPAAVPARPRSVRLVRARAILRRRQVPVWTGVLGAVVVANVLFNPMVPVVPAIAGALPLPFYPTYYEPSLTVEPGVQWLEQLVREIPAGATVGASNNLLLYVANDLAAYRLTSANLTRLPFNYTGGPQYVLSVDSAVTSGGPSLTDALGTPSEYGLRGYVEQTPVGPIVLYEKGYSASPVLFGPAVAPSAYSFFPGHALEVSHAGVLARDPSAPTGVVVESNLVLDQAGRICNSTVGFLPAGTYTLTVELEMSRVNASSGNRSVGVGIVVQGLGLPILEENLTGSQVNATTWSHLTFTVTVPSITVDTGLSVDWRSRGYDLVVAGAVWSPT